MFSVLVLYLKGYCTPCIFLVQFLKIWHMLRIVATITGIGVLLLLTNSTLLAIHHPVQVSDAEDPEGRTVLGVQYCAGIVP